MNNRQAIFDALKTSLQAVLTKGATPICKHCDTDADSINEESMATLPAVYIVPIEEPIMPDSDNPPREEIDVQLWVYVQKGGRNRKDGFPQLAPILDAIDQVVGRQAKDPVTQHDNSLGGLVRWARRTTPTKYYLDLTGTPLAAIVGVKILVNQ